MAIRGSAEEQRLPNIIRQSLALAMSTVNNKYIHSYFSVRKSDYIQIIIVTEENYSS